MGVCFFLSHLGAVFLCVCDNAPTSSSPEILVLYEVMLPLCYPALWFEYRSA